MADHSSVAELEKVLWADAELQSVTVDYDSVTLGVRESNGELRTVRAEGYIGYSLMGFWDEIVVDRAELVDAHPGLDACVNSIRSRLGARWPASGDQSRNEQRWFALLIHFSDGSVLEVFAARLTVV